MNKSQTTQGDINYSPGINKNIGRKTNSAYKILVFLPSEETINLYSTHTSLS